MGWVQVSSYLLNPMITTLKNYVNEHFKSLLLVFLCVSLSLLLLMLRIKFSGSERYLFLVWNLFLAGIPYAISTYIHARNFETKWKVALLFGLWLLFLPNAPYILTDFIHLSGSRGTLQGYDFVMLSSFSLAGLLLYFLSLGQMRKALTNVFKGKLVALGMPLIPFIVGFGIYLGRFLRWNSWDIIQDPKPLLIDIAQILFQPSHHITSWVITLVFGVSLLLGNYVFSKWWKRLLIKSS